MFISKRKLEFILEKLQEIEVELAQTHKELNTQVECEVCGCLLKKYRAIAIEIKVPSNFYPSSGSSYARYRYYCKVHAPKPKTKGKK